MVAPMVAASAARREGSASQRPEFCLTLYLKGLPLASSDKAVCDGVAELSLHARLRSQFVALSGRGDEGSDFKSLNEFCGSLRRGMFLDPMLIPAFEVDAGTPVPGTLLVLQRRVGLIKPGDD